MAEKRIVWVLDGRSNSDILFITQLKEQTSGKMLSVLFRIFSTKTT